MNKWNSLLMKCGQIVKERSCVQLRIEKSQQTLNWDPKTFCLFKKGQINFSILHGSKSSQPQGQQSSQRDNASSRNGVGHKHTLSWVSFTKKHVQVVRILTFRLFEVICAGSFSRNAVHSLSNTQKRYLLCFLQTRRPRQSSRPRRDQEDGELRHSQLLRLKLFYFSQFFFRFFKFLLRLFFFESLVLQKVANGVWFQSVN